MFKRLFSWGKKKETGNPKFVDASEDFLFLVRKPDGHIEVVTKPGPLKKSDGSKITFLMKRACPTPFSKMQMIASANACPWPGKMAVFRDA